MEWRIVATHCPDDRDETHEDGNTIGKVSPDIEVAPHIGVAVPLCQALTPVGSIIACRDNNDDNEQGDDVERTAGGVELGNPTSRHGADATMDDHDNDSQQKHLVVLRSVVRVRDGDTGQEHCRKGIVDGRSPGNLD